MSFSFLMKRLIKYFLLATIVLIITAAILIVCIVHLAPSYFDLIVKPSDWRRPSPVDISRSDAQHDWAVFERIIRTGYAGYDYYRAQGKDWNAMFAEGRRAIDGKSEVFSTCDFAQIIEHFINQVEDHHLGFYPRPTNCRKIQPSRTHPYVADLWISSGDGLFVDAGLSSSDFIEGAQLVECPGFDLEKDLHFAAIKKEDKWHFGLRLIYLSKTSKQPISCRFRRPDGTEEYIEIAVNRLSNNRTNAKLKELLSVETGETTYFRLGSFSRNHEEYSKFLWDLPRYAPEVNQSRVIVVDLQGNLGGGNEYFNWWMKSLKANPFEGVTPVLLNSETTSQGRINWMTEMLSHTKRDWDSIRKIRFWVPNDLWTLVSNAVVRRGTPFSEFSTRRFVLNGRAEDPFAGDMMLIVDDYCSSACEEAVLTSRRALGAVGIGTNSNGAMNFISDMPYRLPKTGLRVFVPTIRNILAGENFREGRGFLPDVWIDLRDGGTMARDFASAFADPAFRDEVMPLIRDAGERWRDLSVYSK